MSTTVLPVIHHLDDETTLENAQIAVQAGCPGLFLIHMNGQDALLDAPALEIKQRWPQLQVGINRLSQRADAALRQNIDLNTDMTWTDNCGVTSQTVEPFAEMIDAERQRNRSHLFFGSVAFKGQAHEPSPALAACAAAHRGWIATTSGTQTGTAPDAKKIVTMKKAIGQLPLAVASGITPENASQFLGHLDYILVATGISRDFYHFDPQKLEALIEVIR